VIYSRSWSGCSGGAICELWGRCPPWQDVWPTFGFTSFCEDVSAFYQSDPSQCVTGSVNCVIHNLLDNWRFKWWCQLLQLLTGTIWPIPSAVHRGLLRDPRTPTKIELFICLSRGLLYIRIWCVLLLARSQLQLYIACCGSARATETGNSEKLKSIEYYKSLSNLHAIVPKVRQKSTVSTVSVCGILFQMLSTFSLMLEKLWTLVSGSLVLETWLKLTSLPT
jgi:hypothetical protein